MGAINKHNDLDVYRKAFAAAMDIFEASKAFPKTDAYSLTDQIRRSSRSVCANLAEAWRKRRYEAAFVSKLSDSEAEAAETQVWLEFSVKCNYADRDRCAHLFEAYEEVIRMIVAMANTPEKWTLTRD
jgi:four helix bundle protein